MDKKMIGKGIMMGLGVGLTLLSQFVNAKNQDTQMKETIAKEVAEALKNQTKES